MWGRSTAARTISFSCSSSWKGEWTMQREINWSTWGFLAFLAHFIENLEKQSKTKKKKRNILQLPRQLTFHHHHSLLITLQLRRRIFPQFSSFLLINIHAKREMTRSKRKMPLWFMIVLIVVAVLIALLLIFLLVYRSWRRRRQRRSPSWSDERAKKLKIQVERQKKEWQMFPVSHPINELETIQTVGSPSEFHSERRDDDETVKTSI